MFQGSFVALITPMHKNGEVDYESLEKLVSFHLDNKTHGIVAVGTTGESATLPFDEHIQVVSKIVEFVGGRIPVIAGTGANSTDEAVFLTKEIGKLGVDGFLSVVPYYNKPQQRGLVAHFNAIADSSDLPLILYNVPSRTVLDMSTDTVKQLASHPNIVGIKDATGDLSRLAEMREVLDDDFLLFSGDDESSCEFMNNGGDGVISVTANIAPLEIANMCEFALAGNNEEAIKQNEKVAKLHELLFVEPNPVMPKWALYKMGLTKDAHLRLPMVIPELNQQNIIEQELACLGLIK